MGQKIKIVFLISILVFVDQISKFIFSNFKLDLISNWIYIESYKNSGSAFSIFSNVSFYNYFIIVFSILVLGFCILKFNDIVSNVYYELVYVLLFSGVIGNLVDRLLLGYVRDFIGVKFFSIFNFADMYLTFAVIVIFYYEFFVSKT